MSRHQAEVPELRKRHLPSVLTSQDKLAPGPQGGKQGQEKGHDAKRDWVASDDARRSLGVAPRMQREVGTGRSPVVCAS